MLVGFLLAAAALAFSQQPTPVPPPTPEDAFATQQLVAWTRMQKPQPTPQPLPPGDPSVPQPDQQDHPDKQSADRSNPPDQSPSAQSLTGQSLTGTIVEDGGKYVLKVAGNNTYELEYQGDLKSFANQTVRVIGNLVTGSNTIRVVKIELLS